MKTDIPECPRENPETPMESCSLKLQLIELSHQRSALNVCALKCLVRPIYVHKMFKVLRTVQQR